MGGAKRRERFEERRELKMKGDKMPIATLTIAFDLTTGKTRVASNGPPLEVKNFWYRVLFEAAICVKDYIPSVITSPNGIPPHILEGLKGGGGRG